MEIKPKRRSRHRPQSTDKEVVLRENTLSLIEPLHRHGDLPTCYLHALGPYKNYHTSQVVLGDLVHEKNTCYPSGARIGARILSRHPMPGVLCASSIYTLNETSRKILQATGRFRQHAPVKSPGQWQHDFLASIVTATMQLAAHRDGHTFHFHDELADEAGGFSFPVTFEWEGKPIDIALEPDPSFALTFKTGKRLNAFVEIDWDSEGASNVSSAKRKSLWRSALQYEQFIGRGKYKEHYQDGGAMVLFFFTNARRMHNFIKTIEERMGGCNYMCFKHVPNFDRMNFTVPKRVLYELYDSPFLRPGRPPLSFSTL